MDNNNSPISDRNILTTRILQIATTVAALVFLLFADYPNAALGGIIALFFAAYVWMRVMVYLDNDRFSPRRLRVGLTWALVGIDKDTDEFDVRPVRVYFVLLVVLFAGLILRPLFSFFL